MRASSRSSRSGRRGASATEFAVVLPVLLLIALGCVDFGRFAYHYITMTNAARAGAEYATMNPYTPTGKPAWETKVREAAWNELADQLGGASTQLVTTIETPTPETGTGLRRVKVTCAFSGFQTVVSWPGIPDSVAIQSAVVMRAVR